MKPVLFFIVLIIFLTLGCGNKNEIPNNEIESKLIQVGEKYYEENRDFIERDEKILKEECDNFNSKYYVFIEQCQDYKGLKLFEIDYWLEEERVSEVKRHKDFDICIKYLKTNHNKLANPGFDYKIDCCGKIILTDLTEWYVLINDSTNQCIVVRSIGIPLNRIKQLNDLEWSDSVSTAVYDSTVASLFEPCRSGRPV